MIVAVIITLRVRPRAYRKVFRFTVGSALKQFCYTVKSEYPFLDMHLINCSNPAPPPPTLSIKGPKLYWCPYCATVRRFVHKKSLGVTRCSICWISDREYFFRVFNVRIGKLARFGLGKKRDKKLKKKLFFANQEHK